MAGIGLAAISWPFRGSPAMSKPLKSLAAGLAHLRDAHLKPGDAIPLPLTLAPVFHSPGVASVLHQYGRFSNPTWTAVDVMLGYLEDLLCIGFPSGMAAISALLFSPAKSGD